MPPPELSEENTDDILYFARAGESTNLISTLTSIAADPATTFTSATQVLLAAQDEYSGNNAVHMAAGNGHFETIKQILALLPAPASSSTPPHAAIAHTNKAGNTPLHWAALNGHVKIVEALVMTANADPTVPNSAGHDAVYEAEVNGKVEVVAWILGNCGGVEEGVGVKGEQEEEAEVEVEEVRGAMEGLGLYKGDSREGAGS